TKHFVQRKRMLRAQGQDDRVIGRGGLQFEIKRAAKAFAEGQAPGAVETRAKRRMDDELHAAGLIKEPLEHEGLLRREHAQRPVTVEEVLGELAGTALGDSSFGDKPSGQILCR